MKKEIRNNAKLPFIRKDVQGNLCIDGEFVFDERKDKLPYEKLLRWMTTGNPQRKEKKADTFKPDIIHNTNFLTSSHDKIVWMGHSSFFIQLNGKKILTDPVFYDLTPLLRRRHGLPCPITHFKEIDIILLSHGHRDHLDIPTLKKLIKQNPDVEILCPLGFSKLLKGIGCKRVHEAAWWQQYITDTVEFTFLPAKH